MDRPNRAFNSRNTVQSTLRKNVTNRGHSFFHLIMNPLIEKSAN
jgi:hypothetical protein